ncbi:MAG: response regulator, partial [Planctomycetes bacterium]|nr:response regulator [Planctomycetota bacterium]
MTFILVVEDDPDFSALYQTALVERGYLVGLASSVQDGLEQLERVHPDFVVVDLDLPDGSGLSVVRAAARHSPPIPAV